jgi:hypothetical protein
MTANVTRSYVCQLSFDDFNAEHNYGRVGAYTFNAQVKSLDDAIASIHTTHHAQSWTSWVAIWIHETTVTVTEHHDEQGRLIRETHTVEVRDAYSEFRSYEDWKGRDARAHEIVERNRAEGIRLEAERRAAKAAAEEASSVTAHEIDTRSLTLRERITGKRR